MLTRFLLLIGCSKIILATGCTSTDSVGLRDGDILFQDFPSSQNEAIKIATQSEYSHCGVVFFEGDRPMVWEAVQPVTITPLDEWIGRSADSHYVAMRLTEREEVLTVGAIEAMKNYGRSMMGRDYDMLFDWSDEQFYCSELVWKIFAEGASIELCQPRQMSEYALDNPIVRMKLQERYGDKVPFDQNVVAPSDIYNSSLLEVVYER